MYNVVLVSGVQGGSVLYIYTHTHIYIQIMFHYRLSQDTEYSFLGYIVGSCCLPILYILLYIC